MNKRLSFTFFIITLTVDAMGISLIIPVMPGLFSVHLGFLLLALILLNAGQKPLGWVKAVLKQ